MRDSQIILGAWLLNEAANQRHNNSVDVQQQMLEWMRMSPEDQAMYQQAKREELERNRIKNPNPFNRVEWADQSTGFVGWIKNFFTL